MKTVKSNIGSEYYGSYGEKGQHLGPFARFIEKRGICAQYIMPSTPQRNGVSKKRYRTLLDMVRSMLRNVSLTISLWSYALKTAMYLQNRVPSKAVQKTHFELWIRRKPIIRRLHVWGCLVEIRYYNPQEKKLDARTINGYFIDYLEKSKGFRFYSPNHATRIIESRSARFIENDEVSGRETPRKVDIQEMRVHILLTCIPNKVILPLIVPQVIESVNNPDEQYEGQINDLITHNEIVINEPRVDEPRPIALRRSQREKR